MPPPNSIAPLALPLPSPHCRDKAEDDADGASKTPTDTTRANTFGRVPIEDVNTNYKSVPLVSSLLPNPAHFDKIIRTMLSDNFGFSTPRQFQVDIIFHMAVRKCSILHLIQKTGEGKSLVLLGILSLLRGVVFVMDSLHGLGNNQANK